jgi:hypothetical protein
MTRCAFAVGFVVCGASCASTPPRPTYGGPSDFDRAAALSELSGAVMRAAKGCSRADGPLGTFRIAVTFATDGHVTGSHIEGPFERVPGDAEVRTCVEALFGEIQLPPFHGAPVTVHKTFWLQPQANPASTRAFSLRNREL